MLIAVRARTRRRVVEGAVALLVALTFAVGAVDLSPSAAANLSRAGREMTVAPSLGLPGLKVRFSGSDVPRHWHFAVLFDVTTSDKRTMCVADSGTSTRWRCTGRVPARYGALGIHTVEMDATPPSVKGGFEELGTFLVTDLGVTMAAPATTAPGDTVQLRVTASNGNSVVARGVTITDALPRGLRLKHATAPCRAARGRITCGPFRMPARSSRVYVFTTIVTAARATRLVDTVSIRGSPDPLRRNDAAHASIGVT
ncbi:MAG TPA: hypothetical protein VGZ33_07615 [Acidimicrobiales bacterium]|nr:hypothetical protein [Acidimicrobiales bacterium]